MGAGLVLMAPAAHAQVVSDPVSNRNYQIQTSVVGYMPGQYVSGTNQGLSVNAWASGLRYTGNQLPWTQIYLTEVMVLVDGEVVKDWTNSNGELVQFKGFTVRRDSTHFQHGITVDIECRAWANVERWSGGPILPGGGTGQRPTVAGLDGRHVSFR